MHNCTLESIVTECAIFVGFFDVGFVHPGKKPSTMTTVLDGWIDLIALLSISSQQS